MPLVRGQYYVDGRQESRIRGRPRGARCGEGSVGHLRTPLVQLLNNPVIHNSYAAHASRLIGVLGELEAPDYS